MNDSFLGKVGKLISILSTAVLMNACFLICCLPIVTIGPAWCGLMGAIRYNVRGEKWFEGFKMGFKTRFLRSFLVGIGAGVFLFITLMDAHANILSYAGGVPAALMPAIMSCVVFAMVSMLLQSLLTLNVYIHTEVNVWMRNGADLIRKAPLQVLVSGVLPWLSLFLALLVPDLFMQIFVIWICVYFSLCALATTLLLKDALLMKLVEARADGTLLSEEGRILEKEEEEKDV